MSSERISSALPLHVGEPAGGWDLEEAWVLSIRQQCEDAGVPFFFKQWGGVHEKAAGKDIAGDAFMTASLSA